MDNGRENGAKKNSSISIPLNDPRALGDFISGLLGQRRSIERRYDERRFEIDFDWLLNLDQIIAQRVSQNAPKLVSFSAVFYFKEGNILTVEDYD